MHKNSGNKKNLQFLSRLKKQVRMYMVLVAMGSLAGMLSGCGPSFQLNEGGSLLQDQSVFGHKTAYSASTDSANSLLGVDDHGRPILPRPAVSFDSSTCDNCADLLRHYNVNVKTPIVPRDTLICEGDEVLSTACPAGKKLVGKNCIKVCADTQIAVNDQCLERAQACIVEGGTGIQYWAANSYGACIAKTCEADSGYVLENGRCVKTSTTTPVCPPGRMLVRGKCTSGCGEGLIDNGAGRCVSPTQVCPILNGKGRQMWISSTDGMGARYSPCETEVCAPGMMEIGNTCVPIDSGGGGGEGNGGDPLVIDLANRAEKIDLSSQLKGILFDLLGTFAAPVAHTKVLISWTTNPRYGFLAIPDSAGRINGVDQLFGDNTVGPDGQRSRDGFHALSKFDGMDETGRIRLRLADGVIDSNDGIFKKLVVWSDLNGNGGVDANETILLSDLGLKSISLKYDSNFWEVDEFGNSTTYKSIVTFNDDRQALIFDLWFRYYQPVTDGCYKLPAK